MIDVAVYDDSEPDLERIKLIIDTYNKTQPVSNRIKINLLTDSTFLMQDYIENTFYPSIYLLDIRDVRSRHDTGFQLAKQIEAKNGSVIIFMTAYYKKLIFNPYFKALCMNFVLKQSTRFEWELIEVIKIAASVIRSQLYYSIHTRYADYRINIDDILYFEKANNGFHTYLNYDQGIVPFVSTLEAVTEQLEAIGAAQSVKRCHKSYIVNINKIFGVTYRMIIFKNGVKIPWSKKFIQLR